MAADLNRGWGRSLQHASHAARLLIKRGTAMAPLFPVILAAPFFFGLAWLAHEIPLISLPCIGLGILSVVHYIVMYTVFALRDPDRLQSESHVLAMTKLQQEVRLKEITYPVSAEALLPATENPKHPLQLPDNILEADSPSNRSNT